MASGNGTPPRNGAISPEGETPLHLAMLLAARLCHDLSGPLLGLSGALELAQEGDPTMGEDSSPLAIASTATSQAVARLRLLRAAWATDPAPLDPASLTRLAEGLVNRHRIRLNLDRMAAAALPPGPGQVLLNLLLTAARALPSGGEISVISTPEQDLLLRVGGPGAAWPPLLIRALAAPEEAMRQASAADIAIPLAIWQARAAGLDLRLLLAAGTGAMPPPLLLGLPRPIG